MLRFHTRSRFVEVPGTQLQVVQATRYPEAWVRPPVVVQLFLPMVVHRIALKKRPGGLLGEWFALGCPEGLGDIEFAKLYAIPGHGNFWFPDRIRGAWRLPAGTVMNVGVCAPLGGMPGGGVQGEWLEGRLPQRVG